jgi:hypothetical protein
MDKEESGGKDEIQNNIEQPGENNIQISSISPFGKGLGKQPLDFEKIAQMYDEENNVINLVPGAGLFFF